MTRRAAEGILAGKVPLGEGLVDDDDVRHPGVVALVEIAAGAQGDSQRLEVARRDQVTVRLRAFAHRRQRAADDGHRRRCLPAGERHPVGERRRRSGRQRRQALEEPLVESDQRVTGIALGRQGQLRGEHAVGLKARLHRLQPGEAGHQQSSGDEQHERQRHLGDQQAGPQAPAPAGGAAAGVLQRLLDVHPRRLQRRQQADGQSGAQRDDEREAQRQRIDGDLERPRDQVGLERDQAAQGPLRQQ